MSDNVHKLHPKVETGEKPSGDSLGVLSGGGYDRLKEMGLWLDEWVPFAELEISEPAAGEHVIGKLTAQEECIFAALHAARNVAEDVSRETGANVMRGAADAVQNRKEDEFSPAKAMSEDQASAYFESARRWEALRELFYWILSYRLGSHAHVLGVRRMGRVVRGAPKFGQSQD